ncbi:NAD(P)H dehydrogenase [quinone] 1-like [Aplochiton taeniatus]
MAVSKPPWHRGCVTEPSQQSQPGPPLWAIGGRDNKGAEEENRDAEAGDNKGAEEENRDAKAGDNKGAEEENRGAEAGDNKGAEEENRDVKAGDNKGAGEENRDAEAGDNKGAGEENRDAEAGDNKGAGEENRDAEAGDNKGAGEENRAQWEMQGPSPRKARHNVQPSKETFFQATRAAKKVLIVYAHQSPGSFNAAAKDAAVKALTAQGCTVEVSDLYSMKFTASATSQDITGEVKNPEHFQYAEETKLAWLEGKLSADITEEQRKVTQADVLLFQFPMYWFSVPAIMKGWIDRVLTMEFAYTSEKRYSQGIFKDKKAMLSFTTGSQESMFSANGINGDMNVTLWPLQNGILHYCGFQVLAPQIFWAPSHVPSDACTAMLDAWTARLQGLLGEMPLSFTPLDSFDKKGFQLKPEIQEEHADKEFGLTIGTHLGKPLPPNNQIKSGV